MLQQRALRIVLVLVGLFFSAAILPVVGGLRDPAHSDTGDTMMMALYCTLGIFLLMFRHQLSLFAPDQELPKPRTGPR